MQGSPEVPGPLPGINVGESVENLNPCVRTRSVVVFQCLQRVTPHLSSCHPTPVTSRTNASSGRNRHRRLRCIWGTVKLCSSHTALMLFSCTSQCTHRRSSPLESQPVIDVTSQKRLSQHSRAYEAKDQLDV